VTRFMAKHPLIAASVMLLGYLALTVGYLLVVNVIFKADLPEWVHVIVFTSVSAGLPLVIALWLTLLRRRSGASAAPLWWLVALLPMEMLAHFFVWFVIGTLTFEGPRAVGPDLWRFFRDYDNWERVLFWIGLAWSGPAALLGILAGLVIARHLFRTGRWETIVGVDRSG